jgi:hypothetical protein
MAQRLAKMERLISDFAVAPNSTDDGSSSAISDSGQFDSSSRSKLLTADSPSPIEEGDFAWAIPESESKSEMNLPKKTRINPPIICDPADGCYEGTISCFDCLF